MHGGTPYPGCSSCETGILSQVCGELLYPWIAGRVAYADFLCFLGQNLLLLFDTTKQSGNIYMASEKNHLYA